MERRDTYDGSDRFGTDSFGMEDFFDRMRRSMMGPAMFDESMMLPAASDEGMRSGLESMGRRNTNLTVERTDDGFLVIADMPGFETDEIDLRFDDGILFVDAEHDVESESEGVVSRQRRSVQERLRVPGDVDEENISAAYRNGVLEIELLLLEASDDDSTRIDID